MFSLGLSLGFRGRDFLGGQNILWFHLQVTVGAVGGDVFQRSGDARTRFVMVFALNQIATR